MIEKAKWQTWTLVPAGAGWMFAIGIVEQNGQRRVRIAKGKMKIADAGELPIVQQTRLNLKPVDWKHVRAAIDRYIALLEGGEAAQQPSAAAAARQLSSTARTRGESPDNRQESLPAKDSVLPMLPKPRTPEQLAQDFAREQATAYTDLESE